MTRPATPKPSGPAGLAVAAQVGLVYFVCGTMGMSLAVPPAQSTPLFPAAGLAVAAVLRHGTPAVAGVWLGQAVMQIVRHGLLEGRPTPALLACWSMLSFGAALQAVVAVALLSRHDARGPHAAEGGRLFTLLFLCGMIACTVSATIGVGTLAAAGFVDIGAVPRAWWEWYCGDTLGVFIFAPLIVLLLDRPEATAGRDILPVLVRMGVLTLLIMAVFLVVRRLEAAGIAARLRDDLSSAVAFLALVVTGILADRDLAAHAARARETLALVEKERLHRDLVIARDIQQGLLPKQQPRLAGFDIAGWNQPADETGGDYYDFVPLDDGRLAIAIADVTGHGIGAALVVAEVRALFRAEIARAALDDAVEQVHALLAPDLPNSRLVTACFAVVCPQRGGLAFVSTGHGPILFRSEATGAVRLLAPQGLPLGFDPDRRYAPAVELPMAPGDAFLVLTDGFLEWADRRGTAFGLARITAVFQDHGRMPAREIIGKLREAVSTFAAGTPQTDDLTAIVVRRMPRA